MLKITVKHAKTERQETQTKVIFTTTDTVSEIDEHYIEKAPGYLLFSADKITQEAELAMRDKRIGVNVQGQSASKKLRGAIYEYWFEHINDQDFEAYYNRAMDKLIDKVKGQI